jgi:spermidine synthase
MLTLVLGSSTHAFELMLSAFITGLAFGGLWVRRRIDSLPAPARFLAFVQVAMGILALVTLPLYGNSFEIMGWLVQNLDKTDWGYRLFHLSSHAIALTVMLPATFCAGMTLPLITYHLLRQGHGEKSIGAVYAFNTIGAIVGVFFAVHLGMPLLGLKGLISLGASLDIGLGLALAWWVFPARRWVALPAASGVGALAVILLTVQLDPLKMTSGVYRWGEMPDPSQHEVLFHRDGKTCSVAVTRDSAGTLSLRTNGKSDASFNASVMRDDEITMVLAGALPLVLNPQARTAENIGMGSGITTHTLLSTPLLERVDTIEIEPAVVEAAATFLPRVALAYDDSRSRIFIEDAKSFFSTQNSKYDVIISEPSNPWVSGVASLFSEEFYGLVTRYLNEGGLLIQWLQLYEIDEPLVVSVVKALSSHFADYAIYAANTYDIMIVARVDGAVPTPMSTAFETAGLIDELRQVSIHSLEDLALRKIGDRRTLEPLFQTYDIRANSDYFPVLDLNAARTRFLRVSATELASLSHAYLPALEMLGGQSSDGTRTDVSFVRSFGRSVATSTAMMLYRYHVTGQWQWDHADLPVASNLRANAELARRALYDCGAQMPMSEWLTGMFRVVAERILPYLKPSELEVLWRSVDSDICRTTLSAVQWKFLSLFKSVGARDAAGMAHAAEELFAERAHMHPRLFEYVVSAAVLGDLASGNKEAARELMRSHGSFLEEESPRPLLIRLLKAHSSEPQSSRN